MLQILTKTYQGADLSGETGGVIFFPLPFECQIQSIKVKTDENVAGDAEFVLTELDNSPIAGTALTIETGTKKGVLTALEIDRSEDADLLLKLTSGAVSSPVTLVLTVEDLTLEDTPTFLGDLVDVDLDDPQVGDAFVFDGTDWVNQPAGGGTSLPAGDLNAETNVVEEVQGRAIEMPSLGGTVSEAVEWDYLNNHTAMGNFLTKSGSNGWNGGGLSLVQYQSDAIAKYTVQSGVNYCFFGLTPNDALTGGDPNYQTYSIQLQDGVVSILIPAGNVAVGEYEEGTVIEVRKIGTEVTVYIDDELVYTYTAPSLSPLRFCAGFFLNGTVSDGFDAIYTGSDQATDMCLMWWSVSNSQFQKVDLVDLKAALDAL